MEVKRTGYFQRIINSFVGALIGILLFFGSFAVLFINEGRENLADYARESAPFDPQAPPATNELIHVIDTVDAETFAADEYLTAGRFIYIERQVYFYGYEEEENRETRENIGGSETEITTYSYHLKWLQDPQRQSSFRGDASELPETIEDYDQWIDEMPPEQTHVAEGLTIDGIPIASAQLKLSGAKDLELTEELTDQTHLTEDESVRSGVVHRSNGTENSTPESPEIGDVKVVFRVIDDDDRGIYLGAYEQDSFVPFYTEEGNEIHRFFQGVESRDAAVDILQSEYEAALWTMRLVGFLMMFVGLLLVGKPLFVLISVIPIFARIGRGLYAVLAFFISLVLTGLTILLGMVFHNTVLAIIAVLALVFGVIIYLQNKRLKAERS
ncbi:MAG: TMEM43 family protein [Acholeplasmataceae bacterium]